MEESFSLPLIIYVMVTYQNSDLESILGEGRKGEGREIK